MKCEWCFSHNRIWKISLLAPAISDSFMCQWAQAWKQQTCQKTCVSCSWALFPNCLIEYYGSTNRRLIKTICRQTWRFPDGFHNKTCLDIRNCELSSHMGVCWACMRQFITALQPSLCQYFVIMIRTQKKLKPMDTVSGKNDFFIYLVKHLFFIPLHNKALKLHLETLTSEKLFKAIHAVIHDSKYRREAKWVDYNANENIYFVFPGR